MGHYASEMDPEWSERVDRTSRIVKLNEELANVPLGSFTCSELKPLMKVLGVYRDIMSEPSDEDIRIVQARLRTIRSQ
jgi:hypothetical protein